MLHTAHRQLRNVATTSPGLEALMKDSLFIAPSEVTSELQGHEDASLSAYTDEACAQFKAAAHIGTRREHYKRMGLAAGCCR
jgi:hypothetical protein